MEGGRDQVKVSAIRPAAMERMRKIIKTAIRPARAATMMDLLAGKAVCEAFRAKI